jgi:hypothetical protein
MPKSGAAVIHMEKILNEVEFLIGEKIDCLNGLSQTQSFGLFSDETIDFLSDISDVILKSPEIRNFSDVATFAFYCRKANLNFLKSIHLNESNFRVGRGILFHIAPGNVPVNFAYSLFAGLVTGNINIIKLPSKNFEQVNLIVNAIKTTLLEKKYKSIFSKRLFLIRYNREGSLTSFFSSLCDVRIIWGGDQTIIDVRKSPIPPKSIEITFADRYSISIINAKKYIEFENKTKVASDFYNDTYLFDQNACTAPQTIYWFGSSSEIEIAKDIFWKLLQQKLTEKKYELQPILSVNKLVTFYSQAISHGDIKWEPSNSNEIWRVSNRSIHNNMDLFKCGSGYFNEVSILELNEINPAVNRKFQTIGYFGFDKNEILKWISINNLVGIDRAVPIGRTMDFSLFWDGFDLVNSLSRIIYVS